MNRDEPVFPYKTTEFDSGESYSGITKGELSDLLDEKLKKLELILYRAAALVGTNDAKRAIKWADELQRAAEEGEKHG